MVPMSKFSNNLHRHLTSAHRNVTSNVRNTQDRITRLQGVRPRLQRINVTSRHPSQQRRSIVRRQQRSFTRDTTSSCTSNRIRRISLRNGLLRFFRGYRGSRIGLVSKAGVTVFARSTVGGTIHEAQTTFLQVGEPRKAVQSQPTQHQ